MATEVERRLRAEYWRNHKSRTVSLERVLCVLLGLGLLTLASAPFIDFPIFGFWFLPLALAYLLALLAMPRLWLLVLPVATVVLHLTPWTGRFVYHEFDYLVLATLASGLICRRYRLQVYVPTVAMVAVLLYVVILLINYGGWWYHLQPPQASFSNPYYSPAYAYKVFKGLLWGVALVPMWGYLLAQHRRATEETFLYGMAAAAIALCLCVVWERGTLGLLAQGAPWWHLVQSLLDLSTSYRVTGLFSDMHTGGETIDGIILLLLPATLHGLLQGGAKGVRILSGLGFVSLGYVTLVGFTRTTYVGFAVVLAAYLGLAYWYRRRAGEPVPVSPRWFLLYLLAGVPIATFVYAYAGSYGLLAYVGILAVNYLANRLPGNAGRAVFWAGTAVCLFIALRWHFDSRWVEASWMWAVLLGLALLAGGALFRQCLRTAPPGGGEVSRLMQLAGCALLPLFVAFALGGYQISDRFSRVADDFGARSDHWSQVIASSRGDVWSFLFGNGVGTFPRQYIAAHPGQVADVGSFSVVSYNTSRALRLGGGKDLALGQRVPIEPARDYTVSIRFKALWEGRNGRLAIHLCERNLIFASNFRPKCVAEMLRYESDGLEAQEQEITINSGPVGARGGLRGWPTMIYLKQPMLGKVVEIEAIKLAGEDGFNLLRNSRFSDGLDYWFSYNDFAHLPWHVKNLYLQVWFESGWLGLLLFLVLLAMLCIAVFRRHSHDSLLLVYFVGVLGVCAFGFFGSPLDSARVSWLFYFYLFAGLAKLRVTHRPRRGHALATGRVPG